MYVDATSSKACSAWHTGQGCLNDCFYFVMQEFFKHSHVVFLEKGGNFNCQKDFKQEQCFVQNFKSDSKGSKKRKGMFSTFELYFKSAFESFLSFVLL